MKSGSPGGPTSLHVRHDQIEFLFLQSTLRIVQNRSRADGVTSPAKNRPHRFQHRLIAFQGQGYQTGARFQQPALVGIEKT